MKRPETVGAVHTRTHTHTHGNLTNKKTSIKYALLNIYARDG